MSFWGELKRRNVFKVGAAYAIVAWLLVQIANTFFPIFHMPGWTVTLVASLLVMGLPVALILAWAYEMTPEGVKLTKKVPLADSITQVTGRKLNYVLAGLLVVAVGYIVIFQFCIGKPPVQTEVTSTRVEQAPPTTEEIEASKTIAVLPFADLSPEKDQEYFVDGLSEELLNGLTKIEDLSVTSRTSAFSFKGTNKTVQEIAGILGVAHILEGSVRKAGNTIRVTAQLIRAADDRHLWSDQYDRKLEDVENILSIQEDIAKAVANELKVKLGVGKSFKQLGGTDSSEAYERYLVAQGQFTKAVTVSELDGTLETIDSALVLDPEFAKAWAMKASIHLMISTFGSVDRSKSEQDKALLASLRAIEIEPNLADGHLVLSVIKISRCDFIEAGYDLHMALELKTESSDLKYIIPHHYSVVGYNNKANNIAEKILQNDPLNLSDRMFYFLSLALLGDMKGAEEEYEKGKTLSDGQWFVYDEQITVLRVGKGGVLSQDEILVSGPIWDVAKEHLNSPDKGLSELRRIYSDGPSLNSPDYFYIALWAAYFGDPEFALDAIRKAVSIDAKGLYSIYLPVERRIRQLPQFKEFIREIGLVDYWEQFGWPDICHPTNDGDFVCD